MSGLDGRSQRPAPGAMSAAALLDAESIDAVLLDTVPIDIADLPGAVRASQTETR